MSDNIGQDKKRLSSRKKKQAMLAALEKSMGIVLTAARTAGVSRNTHYRWLQEDPKYREAVEEFDDNALDFAESMLFKNVNDGKEASIFFLLKCRGKKRGYVERTEIDHGLGSEVSKFVFELHKDEPDSQSAENLSI